MLLVIYFILYVNTEHILFRQLFYILYIWFYISLPVFIFHICHICVFSLVYFSFNYLFSGIAVKNIATVNPVICVSQQVNMDKVSLYGT